MSSRFELQPTPDSDQNLLGQFLVATPALNGNQFQKSVILVLQDNEKGTFGVVLNRPANDEMRMAWQDATGHQPYEQCVVQGGPVGGPVFAIHQDATVAEVEMPGGIFVSADSNSLRTLTEQGDDRYRIVFGVASWQVGQLDREIAQGVWYTVRADADEIFEDSTWMWEKSIRRYSDEIIRDITGVWDLPVHPGLN